ncbi:phosphopantothenoylcysteine decarboxylase complex subunit [Starmerella bacillaris]|uniref:Phosphopantothenoylcysteine decarboxylase complex subunit n=1 Tax=Starmerella bacillaris TaxID=1247836 RepID=A0AAV5REZ7_STABA|nr:phosphopantothenoylcysteine decarboxylase complex subunit [Starmerella bacillaris]
MRPTSLGTPEVDVPKKSEKYDKPERIDGNLRNQSIRRPHVSRTPSLSNLSIHQSSLDTGPNTKNVSFSSDISGMTAKFEHNPPAVLRRVEAQSRQEYSPTPDGFRSQTPSTINSYVNTPSGTPPFGPVLHNPFACSGSISNIQLPPVPLAGQTSSINSNGIDDVHILLAVTGSVATIKLPLIVHKLKQLYRKRAVIQIVATKASTYFFDPSDLPKDIKVWYDRDEWRSRIPYRQGEGVSFMDHQLHIQLRRWADVLLVAPCSANTLAKLTHGICDNLLTSTFRVWNPEVPVLLAPAMNTHMYTNPVTKRHFDILKKEFPFVEVLKPVEKVLVCGDIGMGGMCEWTEIVQILVRKLGVPFEDDENEDSDSS